MTAVFTPTDEAVEAAAEAMKSTVPNSNGVLWTYHETDMETGDDHGERPVTLHEAARAALAAAGSIIIEQAVAAEREPVAFADIEVGDTVEWEHIEGGIQMTWRCTVAEKWDSGLIWTAERGNIADQPNVGAWYRIAREGGTP